MERLWALEHLMLRPGVLESAGLAGQKLLARKLTRFCLWLWALEHLMLRSCRPGSCWPEC